MEIKKERIKTISFKYDTIVLPPPFCHRYKIEFQTKDGKPFADLDLEYYDRESIDADSILNEGFSLDDDYHWKGELRDVWWEVVIDKISRGTWRKRIEAPDIPQAQLICNIKSKDGTSQELYPDNLNYWDHFLQEIIQAIYEESKLEYPLELQFVDGRGDIKRLVFSFAERSVKIRKATGRQGEDSTLSWARGQKLLKRIFTLDYDYEQAITSKPKTKGTFINTGDGYWHNMNQFKNDDAKTVSKSKELVKDLNDL
jgi:hypothetical protein